MISLVNINKIFRTVSGQVNALRNINLDIQKGDFIVLKGPSGSGKTTLLLTIGTMLKPTSGKVLINDLDIYSLTENERTRYRASQIGFVFQEFHLLPYLNVLDNILLSAAIKRNGEDRKKAMELTDELGLSHRILHKPCELSAGEQQRVALARALIHKPDIILADEPTGNLDHENSMIVITFLNNYHKSGGTVIMGSHRNDADPFANRIMHLEPEGAMKIS